MDYHNIAFQDAYGFDMRIYIREGISAEKIMEIEDGLESLMDTLDEDEIDLADCVHTVLGSFDITYEMPIVEYTVYL